VNAFVRSRARPQLRPRREKAWVGHLEIETAIRCWVRAGSQSRKLGRAVDAALGVAHEKASRAQSARPALRPRQSPGRRA